MVVAAMTRAGENTRFTAPNCLVRRRFVSMAHPILTEISPLYQLLPSGTTVWYRAKIRVCDLKNAKAAQPRGFLLGGDNRSFKNPQF